MARSIFIYVILLFGMRLYSQDAPGTYRIREDLLSPPAKGESGVEAVVLFDSTNAWMEWNNGFRVAFSRHVRIKIFKPSGFSWSYVQIALSGGDKLLHLEASTYNMEDSVVQHAQVPAKQVYTEKTDPFHRTVRFTFPNVRAGSVIEYAYSLLQQDIWDFHSMRFQRVIPVRYVAYSAAIPAFFNYSVYYTKNDMIRFGQVVEPGRYNGHGTEIRKYTWEGSNLPPFVPEPMMPEGDQALAGVDFDLSSVNYPGAQAYLVSPSYEALTEEFLDRSTVGKQLDNALLFSRQVSRVCEGILDPVDKMKAIYTYVQQRMQWNGYEQLWPDHTLKKAAREGTGTSAEINLIMVNMLRTAGIQADPVVMNTRNRGPVITRAAVVRRLNYLICCATIKGNDYLLDATDKYRPAGMLPFKCLNDKGWVVSKSQGRWVQLMREERFGSSIFYDLEMSSDRKIQGKAYLTFYGYDAIAMRKIIRDDGAEGFLAALENKDFAVTHIIFSNLDSLSLPLRADIDIISEDLVQPFPGGIFFKPLITFSSPFDPLWIADERLFPMDVGCPRSFSVKGRIRLPSGVTTDELPTPLQIRLAGKNISFLAGNGNTNDQISFTAELNIGEPFLATEEYPNMRAFLLQVNGRFNEMVVCKEE